MMQDPQEEHSFWEFSMYFRMVWFMAHWERDRTQRPLRGQVMHHLMFSRSPSCETSSWSPEIYSPEN